ncbi:ATP-binding protein [Halovenus halobia]|uniref:ATP-binding protein n=1 Tax=Halovenus halobia TaxID=3396622 RepID=UPI003F572689
MSQAVHSADEARHQLYEIMKRDASFEQKATEALELGRAYLNVDSGFLTRVDTEADHWETVISTDGTDGIVPPGMKANLSGMYCRYTLERESPLALHDIPDQDTEIQPEHFDCYHGTTLTVDGETYGTVCFVARESRSEAFSEAETMFAELVSRLLEHELEHERQREQLSRQTSLVNVLDRVLRHNIRNELTIIRANARMHSEQHDECVECEQIVTAADELIGMSETARQLGKAINADLDRRPRDLATVVRSVVEQAREMYPNLTVDVDTPDRLVVAVYPSVETALWELLENVAEHTGERPHATISLSEADDRVHLEVADDGPGLPDSEQDVLQAGTETQLAHGSGLGLWSVYWVALNHRGELRLDTTDGTRVTLLLPNQAADEAIGSHSDPQIERAGERYETAFESAPTGLAILAEDGEVLEANAHAKRLLDCGGESERGLPVSALVDATTGPLDDDTLSAGQGRLERADQTLSYRLATDVGAGQNLLVIEEQ